MEKWKKRNTIIRSKRQKDDMKKDKIKFQDLYQSIWENLEVWLNLKIWKVNGISKICKLKNVIS